jgi:ribosome-binding protein aMBF1 (putative translation factor)
MTKAPHRVGKRRDQSGSGSPNRIGSPDNISDEEHERQVAEAIETVRHSGSTQTISMDQFREMARVIAEQATLSTLKRVGLVSTIQHPQGQHDLGELKARWKAEFGAKIKAERESRGLSQSAFAKVLGLQQAHISQIEGGRLDPRVSTIYTLARAIGVRPSTLLPDITSP